MRTLHVGVPTVLAFAAATACGSAANEATEEPIASETDEVTSNANALTRAESNTALKLIDDVCGDTWCEGDYDFRFRRLTCRDADATCNLKLEVLPREGAAGSASWRACRTGGFSGFESLVVTDATGYASLQPAYYSALSDCILAIESSMR